jgi:Response regulator receiver domain
LLKRLLNDPPPGCILLDVKMPGVSGPELQTRLNGVASALPIIFLSGHADIPTTVQVIKAGAEDLLTKPVAKDRLVEVIELALAHSRTARDKHEQLDVVRKLILADDLTAYANPAHQLFRLGTPSLFSNLVGRPGLRSLGLGVAQLRLLVHGCLRRRGTALSRLLNPTGAPRRRRNPLPRNMRCCLGWSARGDGARSRYLGDRSRRVDCARIPYVGHAGSRVD